MSPIRLPRSLLKRIIRPLIRFPRKLTHGRDDQGADPAQRPESVRRDGRGSAAVMPDAADVPVEFSSTGVPADPADRLGEVPLLRRGVHAQIVGLPPAQTTGLPGLYCL